MPDYPIHLDLHVAVIGDTSSFGIRKPQKDGKKTPRKIGKKNPRKIERKPPKDRKR
jgi:hypothetical protein